MFLLPLLAASLAAQRGPLRILVSNPRYFTDGSGRAIYLAGNHNWGNFQDSGHRSDPGDPPPVSDFPRYLDFLQRHNHNFFRLWRWETPKWSDTDDDPARRQIRPATSLAAQRSGTGQG